MLGYILLVFAYMLPAEKIRDNVKNSIEQYNNSGTNPEWSTGYEFTLLDEYTDATFILSNVIYPRENESTSPFVNAAMVPHYDYVGVNNDAVYELEGYDGDSFLFNYVRYWHGYLIFLKPLLYLMSLNSVRILNFIFEFVMISIICQIAAKVSGYRLSFALMIAFLLLNPISTGMNFQLAAVMNVTLIATLTVLLTYKNIDIKKTAPIFFMLIGIAVVYVDFLTYPIVSLIIPLLTFIILRQDEILNSIIKGAGYSLIYLMFWGIGYIGMWLLKWIIATIVSKGSENALKEAFEQIIYRSGNGEVRYGFAETVLRNLNVYAIRPFIILLVVLIIVFIIAVKKQNERPSLKWNILIPAMIIGCFPLLWYFGAREHSMDHFSFTFRNLAGTAMALVIMAESTLQKEKSQ